ncbi:MAG: hypothetical protein J3K34DRAFT_401254 [Monoraphidium minutum]|nr:MAG: hypothetical protein J3K34DRAFT_401254 [Monoraphidium minutum]
MWAAATKGSRAWGPLPPALARARRAHPTTRGRCLGGRAGDPLAFGREGGQGATAAGFHDRTFCAGRGAPPPSGRRAPRRNTCCPPPPCRSCLYRREFGRRLAPRSSTRVSCPTPARVQPPGRRGAPQARARAPANFGFRRGALGPPARRRARARALGGPRR